MWYLLLHAVDIIYMIPKHGGKSGSKRKPLAAALSWQDTRSHLMRVMGYEDDEDFDVLYRLSTDPKSTQNALDDEDDYNGIVQAIVSRRKNSKEVQVIIIDNGVCL